MSTTFVVPTADDVAKLLNMLFGDGTEVSECEIPDLSNHYLATFLDDDDKLVSACVCDLNFVGYSGAGLSMIPVGAADDMIASNDLSKTLQGNFYEIMNICSKLMMTDDGAHLRVAKVVVPDEAGEVLTELQDSPGKVGFEVDIPRYGKGKLYMLIN